jgi:uncharacterized membrane protein
MFNCAFEKYKKDDLPKLLDMFNELYKDQVMNRKEPKVPVSADDDTKECIAAKLEVVKNDLGERTIPFFEEMKTAAILNAYGYTPSLYINGELVRGIDNGDVAASAVCDSFKEVPASCKGLYVDIYYNGMNLGKYFAGMFFVIVVCVVLFGIVFFIYKKAILGQADKDMNEMVNYHLERYQNVSRDSN